MKSYKLDKQEYTYNTMAISLSSLYLNALTFRGQSLNDTKHFIELRFGAL